MPDEPAAHADLGSAQRDVEARPAPRRDKRKRPAIGHVAFQREVDGQDQAHRDGEQRARPILERKQQVGGAVAGEVLDLVGEIAEVDLVGERKTPHSFHDARKPRRHLLAELLKVPNHRRKGKKAKSHQAAQDHQQEDEDGHALKGLEAPDAQVADELHQRLKHDGKQRADVKQDQHVAQQPCHVASQRQCKRKGDVAAKTPRRAD